MITGEQLSAYVADELDAEEREAVEAALDRDPDLRAQLQRLRDADETLGALPPVTPPSGFSERLHGALDRELQEADAGATDELATRRERRFEAFRPLAVAAAAAAVIALFGVAGVWLLQGGGGDSGLETAGAPLEAGDRAAAPGVTVVETDNDFDEQELRRLAVNVEISELVPRGLRAPAASPLAEELQGELFMRSTTGDSTAAQDAVEPQPEGDGAHVGGGGGEGGEGSSFGAATSEGLTSDDKSTTDVVSRCLPTVLEDARSALIPVYVELARFDGEPAVIYTLVSEDPESGTYRRVEVWALARSDCQVLSFAQYDRE